ILPSVPSAQLGDLPLATLFLAVVDAPRFLGVALNLGLKFLDSREFFLRAEIPEESYLDVAAVNILLKVKQVQFKQPFSGFVLNRRPNADIDHTPVLPSIKPCLGGIDPVGWELFVMSSQISCGKTQAPAQLPAFRYRSENREFPSQERVGEVQGSALDCRADQCAADHLL